MEEFVIYKTVLDHCTVKVPKQRAVVPHDTVFEVTSGVAVLIDALRHKRPTWQFVHEITWMNSALRPSVFTVYEKGQPLGKIGAEAWGNTEKTPYRYTFNNARLEAKRTRGYETRTTDLRKAVREITGSFFPKTTSEIVEEARKEAYPVLNNAVNKKMSAFEYPFNALIQNMRDELVAHWDTVLAAMAPTKHILEQASAIPELYAEYKQASALKDTAGDNAKHELIVASGDIYIHANKADDVGAWLTYTDDTLPAHIRRGLGVLKLTDRGTVIGGVGIRAAEHVYIIHTELEV